MLLIRFTKATNFYLWKRKNDFSGSSGSSEVNDMKSLIFGFISILLNCLLVPVSAQELSARDIIDRAVETADAQRDSNAELRYQAIINVTTEKLDRDGVIESAEEATYREYGLEGALFEELIGKDGEPLSARDKRDEQKRREKFAEEVRKRREEGKDPRPEDENRIEFNDEFTERFEFALVGQETITRPRGTDTYPCWVLEFSPREGDLPERRRIDTALNKSSGRVWIAQEDYGIVQVEFQMNETVPFWGGIVGRLRNTVGHISFMRTAEQIWLVDTVNITLDLRIFFSNIHRRIIRTRSETTLRDDT